MVVLLKQPRNLKKLNNESFCSVVSFKFSSVFLSLHYLSQEFLSNFWRAPEFSDVCVVYDQARKVHVTPSPLPVTFHWLSIAARIKFKSLTLAYSTLTGSAPS